VGFYILPGSQPLPPQATQCNTYIHPGRSQPALPEPLLARDQDRPHNLFAEWRAWHGDDCTRADDLNPAVRHMIDAKERTAAIRQALPKLANTQIGGFKLEARTVGNPIRYTLYRVVESVAADTPGGRS
jgi:hypothetical protein